MKRRRHRHQVAQVEQQLGRNADILLQRAWRSRRRGDERRAMLLLREAACKQAESARIWTLYGAQCLRAKKPADAERALRQALWLRERARDSGRARSTRVLVEQVSRGLPLKAA